MFAVVGEWAMDKDMRDQQAAALPALDSGVSQNEGFVRGFWTEAVDDPTVSLTFIVFETLDQALTFRQAVTANAPGQAEAGVDRAELRIVRVTADA